MRTLAISCVLLVAVPALADHHRWGGAPVVVDRDVLRRKLARVNEALSEAINKSRRGRNVAEILDDAQERLEEISDAISNAPDAQTVEAAVVVQDDRRHDMDSERAQREWLAAQGQGQVVVVHDRVPPPPPSQPLVYPIADGALRNLLGAIQAEGFPRERLRVLQQAAPSNWFVVSQVQTLLAAFDFPSDRLNAARALKPRILDRENFFQLYRSFDFPNDKEELKRILAQ